MIQHTLENRIILYLLEALLGGLAFLICVGKKGGTPPREAHGLVAFAFLCFSGAAFASSLVPMSLLRGRGFLDLVRLFFPPSVLEAVFLGALVVGLFPSRRSRTFAAVLLAVLSPCWALHSTWRKGSDLYAEFVLRLGMSLIVVTGFFALLLSETLRQGYLEVAANDAQIHLGEFLQGHVGYLHRQGLAPNVIVGRDELVRKIVAEFTRVPGLKRVKLSVGDRQLLAEIDPDGVISIRTGTGIFDDPRKRVYDYDDSTVGILRIPVTSGGKPIATLQFDADLLFVSRTVGDEMLLSFSSLLAVAFAAFIGTLFYNGYQRMQRVAALQAQVQQAQKMEAIGLLAGGIAHDFNNLLTTVLGYSELLLEQLQEGSSLRPDVEEIKKAGERAALLTRQLLAFSRKQILQAAVLDLNSVVRNMEAMLRQLIREDVEIVVVADPALRRVKADATQIEQVILNLAVNARDAMPQGGRLTMETANVELDKAGAQLEAGMQPGRYVALTVRDTGLGMNAEVRARVFEPFFTTKPKDKGTGLGLSMAHGIVTQSGGSIRVDSEPGRGAMFAIYLPAVDEEGRVVAVEAAERVAGLTRGSETVLVVEDEAPVRALAREVLRRNGYTVFEANGGQEALSLSQSCPGPIHLLLTDLVMPGMSGRILAERLGSLRPAMKVLYMSGYTDDAILQRAVGQTDVAFLPKPFTADILVRKVREVLDSTARRPIRGG